MVDGTVSHVGVCVSDMDRSRAFYEGALGFKFARDHRNRGSAKQDQFLQLENVDLHAVFLEKKGFVLELLSYANRPPVTGPPRPMNQLGMTHISITVNDMASALAAIRSSGGEVLEATFVGGVACFVRDPDGQLIELVSASAAV